MTNLINLISERKFNEAEQELSSMFVSIMEQKLLEMKKATAAKMCEGIMGTVGPDRSAKLRSGVLEEDEIEEAADPKEDSTSVERGTPQPPKNTTVINKSEPGSTHYKNMEEETEQLDELSPAAKKKYVDAVNAKPGIFKGIRRSSLAGIEGDKQALKAQADRSEKDPRQSAWSTSSLKRAHKNLEKKQQRRKNIADKVAASLEESANQEELDEARINIVKARIRGGKIQRRKKVSNVPGMVLRGGQLKRMSAAERRRRKMGARKAKVKIRAKLTRTLMKRKRSLQKRKSLGL